MKKLHSRKVSTVVAAFAIVASAAVAPALGTAVAQGATLTPQQVAGQTAQSVISPMDVTPEISQRAWYQKYKDDSRVQFLQATSPAMNGRVVPLAIIPAGEPGRPTIYLLNGAGSGEQDTDWLKNSSVVDFYSNLKVNVVIPMTGAFSYYTDWVDEPNAGYLHGPQRWETFLTKELPGPIENRLQANNKRAIAGMSMSATSALLLSEHNPGFYDATGSFAGCAATADPLSNIFVRLTVNRGGAQPEQVWGPLGSDYNRWNDALLNSERLRGSELYISASSGLWGPDIFNGLNQMSTQGGALGPLLGSAYGEQATEGSVIEGAVSFCTHNLQAKLNSQGIPADYNFRDLGIHNWTGWEDDLSKSWPTFYRAFYMK